VEFFSIIDEIIDENIIKRGIPKFKNYYTVGGPNNKVLLKMFLFDNLKNLMLANFYIPRL